MIPTVFAHEGLFIAIIHLAFRFLFLEDTWNDDDDIGLEKVPVPEGCEGLARSSPSTFLFAILETFDPMADAERPSAAAPAAAMVEPPGGSATAGTAAAIASSGALAEHDTECHSQSQSLPTSHHHPASSEGEVEEDGEGGVTGGSAAEGEGDAVDTASSEQFVVNEAADTHDTTPRAFAAHSTARTDTAGARMVDPHHAAQSARGYAAQHQQRRQPAVSDGTSPKHLPVEAAAQRPLAGLNTVPAGAEIFAQTASLDFREFLALYKQASSSSPPQAPHGACAGTASGEAPVGDVGEALVSDVGEVFVGDLSEPTGDEEDGDPGTEEVPLAAVDGKGGTTSADTLAGASKPEQTILLHDAVATPSAPAVARAPTSAAVAASETRPATAQAVTSTAPSAPAPPPPPAPPSAMFGGGRPTPPRHRPAGASALAELAGSARQCSPGGHHIQLCLGSLRPDPPDGGPAQPSPPVATVTGSQPAVLLASPAGGSDTASRLQEEPQGTPQGDKSEIIESAAGAVISPPSATAIAVATPMSTAPAGSNGGGPQGRGDSPKGGRPGARASEEPVALPSHLGSTTQQPRSLLDGCPYPICERPVPVFPQQRLRDPDEIARSDCAQALPLRVICNPYRTGFEESKEFPVVINSLIAGRYQVWLAATHTSMSPSRAP